MILFLESRSPKAIAAAGSRLTHEQLTDQFLVALDLKTGKSSGKRGHDFSGCQYMTYLVYNQGTAIITGTDQEKVPHLCLQRPGARAFPGGDDLEKSIPAGCCGRTPTRKTRAITAGTSNIRWFLTRSSFPTSGHSTFDPENSSNGSPERRGCGIMSASHRAVFFRHHYQGVWDLATNRRSVV